MQLPLERSNFVLLLPDFVHKKGRLVEAHFIQHSAPVALYVFFFHNISIFLPAHPSLGNISVASPQIPFSKPLSRTVAQLVILMAKWIFCQRDESSVEVPMM